MSEVREQVRAARWVRPYPGVYRTGTGEPSREAVLWAALLVSGDGAALCRETAAEVWGFGDRSESIHIVMPATRRTARRDGIEVARSRWARERTDPRATPPRTTAPDTVLDLVEASSSELDAIGWITRATGSRVTTPKKLQVASLQRPAMRYRRLVDATCAFVADGAKSPLEIGWVQRVERPHGLPQPVRQGGARGPRGQIYRDLDYGDFGVVVELDGRLGHDDEAGRFRDLNRDNAAAATGKVTLRYGWSAVFATPCEAAWQLAAALTARGWAGVATPCAQCAS